MSDQSQDAADADDLSGLTSFFFYVFIVHPITGWIMRPGRFPRKKSIMYAVGFLGLLAAVKTGYEMDARGPNHYQRLGVTRSSNPLAIKRAYKKLSLQLHPDKNPSPDATDQFDAVKQAYDVLMDMELRDVYDKFGKEGIANNKRYDETQFLLELGIFYVSYGMMVFLLTMGKKSGEARNWTFTGLLVMLVIEVTVITSLKNPIPPWLAPQMTQHEIVWLLHSLFPAFMNGCRSLGAYLYVDLDGQTRKLLLALQEQNKDMLLVLRDIQIGVQNFSHGGSNQRVMTGDTPVTSTMPQATPTGKLKDLQQRLQSSNTNVAKAAQQLKSDRKSVV